MLPSEILRSPDLLPSEKLVFARLLQFAGGKGKAWPSIERLSEEVALSVPQTRRCVSSLESKGLLRRVARSGRSNEFEFLWHRVYEQAGERPQLSATGVPRSPMIAAPRSSAIGGGRSHMSAQGQSPVIRPGRSSVIARRESIQSSSSEEIQIEKNQQAGDDDRSRKRESLNDPEQEFLLRLNERHGDAVDRHAILQCVTNDLKSFSDLVLFLEFERKQTTAPEKLRNPVGHYRKTVQMFYESRAKRRDWDLRSQMRAIEARIGLTADRVPKKPLTCSLLRCSGTGECWDEAGVVSACECDLGRALAPKVLAAFDEINASGRK